VWAFLPQYAANNTAGQERGMSIASPVAEITGWWRRMRGRSRTMNNRGGASRTDGMAKANAVSARAGGAREQRTGKTMKLCLLERLLRTVTVAGSKHARVAAHGRRQEFGVEQKGHKMKLRHLVFGAALALTATQARAQFSDTSIGVRDGWTIANPGGSPSDTARNVNKIIVNVGHFDVWDYGTNFFNVDILFSNANEPAYNSAGGSTEFYAVYRAQLSPDKIFGLNTKFGPLTAVNFEFGGDAEAENTQFAPDKKLIVFGPNFNFALPAGFLNIGVHASHEWNNNGFASCSVASSCTFSHGGPVNFNWTPEFEFVWLYSLKGLTGIPIDFKGFMNVVLPKGQTGFGGNTYIEILARPTISLDLGTLLFNKPHKPDIYFAVELWEHKFGNPTQLAGSEEVAPEFGIEYHF
jgi:nucleoside-specific outer membrane channel protein Tsx